MPKLKKENPKTDGFVMTPFAEVKDEEMAIRVVQDEDSSKKYKLVQSEHWSLWHIEDEKGRWVVDGQFTSEKSAEEALASHLRLKAMN